MKKAQATAPSYQSSDPLLTIDEVIIELGGISHDTLRRMIQRKLIPEGQKLSGNLVKWPLSEILEARRKLPRGRGSGGPKPRKAGRKS